MRKFLFACGMISLMLFTLTACGSEDPAEEISRALHIDVSAGEEISSSDTHGGFHGDGISCVALQFPDSQVADAIAANAAWTPLPLDETAQAMASPERTAAKFSARALISPMTAEIPCCRGSPMASTA